jgi:S-adenosylmethionine hydrolase
MPLHPDADAITQAIYTRPAMSVVTFLSDYGLDDDFVGVCHGVIAQIAPDARVIDVTHGIARHDVRCGALVLRRALAYLPPGVHLAVVDPGVGSERRAVALRCAGDGRLLVGPDNGLLTLAAQRFGGVAEAVDLAGSPFALDAVSASFHGRDLFAPVAAQLAAGATLAQAGTPLDPVGLVALELPRAQVVEHGLLAHVLLADGYGNVLLDAEPADVAAAGLERGRAVVVNGVRAAHVTTFADVPAGGLLLYEDAYGALSLSINRGSALAALGLGIDDPVRIEHAS